MMTLRTLVVLFLSTSTLVACAKKKSSDEGMARKPANGAEQGKDSTAKLDNDGDGQPDDLQTEKPQSPAPAPAPAPQPEPPAPRPEDECYKADKEICAVEKEIWRLTNELRKQNGRAEFEYSAKVAWVSRQWSEAQASRGMIGHAGFPNQRSSQYQQEFSERFGMGGENVAMTGGGDISSVAQQFFDMWKNSPGHRANMLGRYEVLGVGVAKSSRGWYGTQIMGNN